MRIKKAQVQTLKYCGSNFKKSYFSHVKLYVAWSSVGSPKDSYIHSANNKIANVVYK